MADDAEAEVALELGADGVEHLKAGGGGAVPRRGHDRRLADAGRAEHDHEAADAGTRISGEIIDLPELLRAPD